MQLHDLVKPIEDMSNEELQERLRSIRHTRTVVRPAAQNHVKKAKKKGMQGRIKKADDLLSQLSEADREALIKSLGG